MANILLEKNKSLWNLINNLAISPRISVIHITMLILI